MLELVNVLDLACCELIALEAYIEGQELSFSSECAYLSVSKVHGKNVNLVDELWLVDEHEGLLASNELIARLWDQEGKPFRSSNLLLLGFVTFLYNGVSFRGVSASLDRFLKLEKMNSSSV